MRSSHRGAIAHPGVAPAPHRTLLVLVARGVRDHGRAVLAWGGGLGVMGGLMAAIWPSIEDSMDELLESYPAGLKQAFGIQALDSVEKYVDAEMLSVIVPFALAFFAIRCAIGATVTAEERGHLDTLLALPVSRKVLVASSFAVTGLALAGILVVIWAITWAVGRAAGTGISAGTLAVGVGNVWPLAMAFAGLAALAAGLLHRAAPVTAVAMATLVAMYVIDLAGKLDDDLAPLRAVSAFRYYGSAIQAGFDLSHAAGLSLASVALTAVGAALFERRDVL